MTEDYEILSFEYDVKGKHEKGLRWDISEMMSLKFQQKTMYDPSFYNVFNSKKNMTRAIKKDIRYRSTGERNVIIEITGKTGSGKSLVSITIASSWMNKILVVDDICFTTESILERSGVIGKNHVLIRDEQTQGFGVGSDREEEERKSLEATTRKFGLNLIFCSPDSRDHSTAHYNLEIICINKKKRMTKVAIKGDDGRYIGYFVIEVLPEKDKLWKAYNKRKDLFIKSILARNTQRLSIRDMSESLKKHQDFKFAYTNEEKKIVATELFPNLTIQEINMVVSNLKILQRKKEAGVM